METVSTVTVAEKFIRLIEFARIPIYITTVTLSNGEKFTIVSSVKPEGEINFTYPPNSNQIPKDPLSDLVFVITTERRRYLVIKISIEYINRFGNVKEIAQLVKYHQEYLEKENEREESLLENNKKQLACMQNEIIQFTINLSKLESLQTMEERRTLVVSCLTCLNKYIENKRDVERAESRFESCFNDVNSQVRHVRCEINCLLSILDKELKFTQSFIDHLFDEIASLKKEISFCQNINQILTMNVPLKYLRKFLEQMAQSEKELMHKQMRGIITFKPETPKMVTKRLMQELNVKLAEKQNVLESN